MATATGQRAEKIYPGGAWPFAALLLGNVALALGPWLVRLADTGPVAAGFWRMALPLPLFAWLVWRDRGAIAITPRIAWILVAAGVFFALDLASWHVGIELTKLGNATLFGNAGSLILMVWGVFALRRAPTRGEAVAVASALAGAAILLASHNMGEVERLCSEVLMMRRGQIVDRGAPAALVARYGRSNLEEVFLDIARERRQRTPEGEAARELESRSAGFEEHEP